MRKERRASIRLGSKSGLRLRLRPHYLGIGGIFVAIVGIVVAMAAVSGEPEESYAADVKFGGITTMQEMTAEICRNAKIGDIATLTDTRGDRATYTIRKHEDGNCWMTQNLRLPGGTQITREDSDIIADFYTLPDSTTKGFSSDNIQYVYNGETNADYALDYGAYYSWCTATADTCKNATISGHDVVASICPKGWKLPTNTGNGSYRNLIDSIGATNSDDGSVLLRDNRYKFNYAGYYLNSSIFEQDVYGYYWTRTARSGTDAYMFYFNDDIVFTSSIARRRGFSVRCVAANALEEISTMQEMTQGVCARASIGDTAVLIDDRGPKYSYIVGRYKDGNCWMMQNLRLPGGTVITTDDSDLHLGSFVTSDDGANSHKLPTSSTSGFADGAARNMYNGSDTYGAYYSWCAATAGCRGVGGSSLESQQNAGSSICPKGWKLPLSGAANDITSVVDGTAAKGSFAYLLMEVNVGGSSDNMISLRTYGFQLGGHYYFNNPTSVGASGGYWSRTANGEAGAYLLSLSNSKEDNPAASSGRYMGYSVRCIADPDRHSTSAGSDSTSANFSVTVDDAITMVGAEFTNSDGGDSIHGVPGSVAEGKISVEVGSNVKYKISMRADSPNLTSSNPDNTKTIPTISDTDTNTPVQSTLEGLRTSYGWGIKPITIDPNPETNDNQYIGILPIDQTFYTSTTIAGASTTSVFPVGVGLSPTLPSDTYSTEVTITAIATE